MKIFTLCVLILAVSTCAFAGPGKPPGNTAPDLPVTSDIADQDSGGMLYSVQSDGFGEYDHGVNGTVSVLMANGYNRMTQGDWLLDLDTVRTVRITLDASNRVDLSAPILGTLQNSARLQNPCTRGQKSMLTMHAGDAMTCPMLISGLPVAGSSNEYQLNMNFWNAPGTDEVLISCNSVDPLGSGCKDWSIDPIPVGYPGTSTSPGKTRARLESVTTKGKSTVTPKGDYYLTFHIHVTRP